MGYLAVVYIVEQYRMMYAGRFRCCSLTICKRSPRRSLTPIDTDSLHARTRGTGWWLRQWTFTLESRKLHRS
ncbi:hypothetical protein BDR03DRAFT_28525 [Suillus americanus]|nr:hypothetical protein BDR03DRAFT_28525 [Suillus americanus]